MSRQFWEEVIACAVANGTACTAAAEGLIFPSVSIPANFMQDGRALRMTAMGKYSNVVTTPGSITFRIRWGGLAGTILAQTSAIALNIVAQTDIMWRLQCEIVCSTNGATGTLLAMGQVDLAMQLAASQGLACMMGSTGGLTTNTPAAVTVDLTAVTDLSLTYQSTVATGSQTGMTYILAALN